MASHRFAVTRFCNHPWWSLEFRLDLAGFVFVAVFSFVCSGEAMRTERCWPQGEYKAVLKSFKINPFSAQIRLDLDAATTSGASALS
jgi:hypothetical protein